MSPDSFASNPSKRVLVVDDERSMLALLSAVLRGAGYLVGTASDGFQGLHMFNEGGWDLVITDRAMPKMDGEQLAEEIKIVAPSMPIIMITGYLKDISREKLFQEILAKPFSRAEILRSIDRVFQTI